MSFLDSLKNAGKSATSIYLRFLQQYKKNDKSLHLFIEGNDDPSFYTNFITNITNNEYKIHFYNSKNKDGVYSNHDKINWSVFNKNKVLFFVDKDYSDILNLSYNNDENIFVTKYYSIENYLINDDMVKRILIELLHITEPSALAKTISHFKTQHESFCEKMMIITSWIIYHRVHNSNLSLSKINLSHVFSFCENLTLQKNTKPLGKKLIEYLNEKTNNSKQNKCWNEIRLIYSDLKTINEHKTHLRGKFEIWFLSAYVNNYVTSLNVNRKKGEPKVKMNINLSHTNAIEILGCRLSIPLDLKTFIEGNITKLSPTMAIINTGFGA
jgi:hypothetical protein